MQILEWIVSVLAARSVCGCLVVLLSDVALRHAASLVDRVFSGHDVLNVYFVIVVYPLALSTTVAWILDGILKRSESEEHDNDPELTVHILDAFDEPEDSVEQHEVDSCPSCINSTNETTTKIEN